MILLEGLGTTQLLLDEEEGVLLGLDGKDRIQVHVTDEFSVGKYLHEIKDGNVMVKGMGGTYDVVLGFQKERLDLQDVIKDLGVHGHPGSGILPGDLRVILVFEETTQVLVVYNPLLVQEIKGRDIVRVLVHANDLGEVVMHERIGIGRRSGEVNNTNLFGHKIGDIHDTRSNKGIVNGLVFFECNLVFVNDDENIGEALDFLDKGRKKIAVEDGVVKMLWETLASLYHPLHRRESSDDENVFVRKLLNERAHGASFSGLRKSDS
jgi:hypothetical protein